MHFESLQSTSMASLQQHHYVEQLTWNGQDENNPALLVYHNFVNKQWNRLVGINKHQLIYWCTKIDAKVVGEGQTEFCSEQHFCSCPPFLKYKSGHDDEIHFTKHNYDEQYAILGKSKVKWMLNI